MIVRFIVPIIDSEKWAECQVDIDSAPVPGEEVRFANCHIWEQDGITRPMEVYATWKTFYRDASLVTVQLAGTVDEAWCQTFGFVSRQPKLKEKP